MRNFFSVTMLLSVVIIAIFPSVITASIFGASALFSLLFVAGDMKHEIESKKCEDALAAYELKKRHRIY